MKNSFFFLATPLLLSAYLLLSAFTGRPMQAWTKQPNSQAGLDENCNTVQVYSTVCIANTLDQEIVYRFRWGNGRWEDARLGPNRCITHWTGDRYRSAQIEFDSDFNSRNVWKSYDLNFQFSHDASCSGATQYQFQWNGGYNTFDLFRTPGENYCP
ncbi:MAG: hypothetical protein ABMA02_09335 [Saprospiraceae bacterium]